jgi:hypothetical protein
MKLKRGSVRDDGYFLNGYNENGKPHWISPEVFNGINFKNQKLRWSNKLKVINSYGGKCNKCSESDPIVLNVDHVFDNGKNHVTKSGKRITGNQLYSNIIKNNYPDCYQILCANCNSRKEWFRRNAYFGETNCN